MPTAKDDVAAILKEMRSPSARKVEFEAVNRGNNREDKRRWRNPNGTK
jgi:hypothetical protein